MFIIPADVDFDKLFGDVIALEEKLTSLGVDVVAIMNKVGGNGSAATLNDLKAAFEKALAEVAA